MKRTTGLLMFGCLVLALAVPAAAAPGAGQEALATDSVAGGILSITPQISYVRADLTVAGPGNYELRQRGDGGAIVANLMAGGGASDRPEHSGIAGGAMMDGKYSYAVRFVEAGGRESVHSGVFFVENGVPVSREQMRSKLDTVAADLAGDKQAAGTTPGVIGPGPSVGTEDDWFFVVDGANDNNTYMGLDSDGGLGNNLYWTLHNVNGDLQIIEDTNFTPPGNTRMMFDRSNDRIGFGDTTAPLSDFHFTGSDGEIRLTGNGESWIIDGDDDGLYISNGSNLPIALLEPVGVGVLFPEADIHIGNADGTGDTVFKFATTTDSWNFGLTVAAGVLTFNKAGTGGQEFTIRERNHATATLDVQGHVRGTSFKATSSRALKTGFEALDSGEVLAKLEQLPVTSWRYKTEDEDVRHFGPVAEDFQRLFGLGDGVSIATVDADGVLMLAVQGLNSELKAQVQAKDAEIEALQARLAAIEEKLAALTP